VRDVIEQTAHIGGSWAWVFPATMMRPPVREVLGSLRNSRLRQSMCRPNDYCDSVMVGYKSCFNDVISHGPGPYLFSRTRMPDNGKADRASTRYTSLRGTASRRLLDPRATVLPNLDHHQGRHPALTRA
jgi:hypothetical protein